MKIRYTGNDERRNLIPGKIYEAQDCEGMNEFGCLLRDEAGEEIRLDEEEFEEMDSYNAAHSEYRAVGLDVWGYDDWKQLDERIGRSWHCRFPSDKGDCYFRLLDEKIWYWWYVNSEYAGTVILYRPDNMSTVDVQGWSLEPGELTPGLLNVWCFGGEEEFPLNVVCPDGFEWNGEDVRGRRKLCMTLFPIYESGEALELYRNFRAYIQHSRHRVSCIPMGTFPLPGNEDFWYPSASVYMSAEIVREERRVNRFTGL